MLTEDKMADLILERDKNKSYAAVDAMTEADAKQMLKSMLFNLHRLDWMNCEAK